MKTRRLITIVAPFGCILFCLWLVRSLVVGRHHASASGVRLSVQNLREGEEMVVTEISGDGGPPRVRGYHVFRLGTTIRIVAFVPGRSLGLGDSNSPVDKILSIHDLSPTEALGLDSTTDEFRKRREEQGFGIPEFRFEYLRNSKLIGEEGFVGYSFSSELAYLRRQKLNDPMELQEGYEWLCRSYGIEYERLITMVPFETFEEGPNQSLEPMSLRVMPSAGAEAAPRKDMAHL